MMSTRVYDDDDKQNADADVNDDDNDIIFKGSLQGIFCSAQSNILQKMLIQNIIILRISMCVLMI